MEKRLIDGAPTTFLEFQQRSRDLGLWRNSELVVDSDPKPVYPEVTIPEPWRSQGCCAGCSIFARMISSQLDSGHPPQNWAVGMTQGCTDCFCGAQDKLSGEQLRIIDKVTIYWP